MKKKKKNLKEVEQRVFLELVLVEAQPVDPPPHAIRRVVRRPAALRFELCPIFLIDWQIKTCF